MDTATRNILDKFDQISRIPRCSKKEDRIADWIARWASECGYRYRRDAAGNLCIKIPAAAENETAPTVVLQGHMDMVCEKTPEAPHDFDRDPIKLLYDGDWVTADQTTLGADNGIALALAMALAEDKRITRPPLELLFTVDEESGLLGAKNLDPGLFDGRILLNLDSEEEGVFTVGCAGGRETRLRLNVALTAVAPEFPQANVSIRGLRGGHSGVDINQPIASANVLLGRTLRAISAAANVHLVSLKGGTVHNAIAREATAGLACDPAQLYRVRQTVAECRVMFTKEYGAHEPGLDLLIEVVAQDSAGLRALTAADTRRAIELLAALPHGVARMSDEIPGLVETSSNLAVIALSDTVFTVLSSQRSSVMSRLAELTARIEAVAALAGAKTAEENSYPSWEPNLASPLLERCKSVYRERFGESPKVKTIHAGLECGLIGAKKPGLDMISFGPTIEHPHSPSERLNIPSIGRIRHFLADLLADLAAYS